MKTTGQEVALLCAFLFGQTIVLLAQGSLTPPPGAPGPTMKTLDQLDAKLEKRIPISSAPFTISAPGSYYVTQNLSVASGDVITIASDSVTLDLNGFTLSSTAASAQGFGVNLGEAAQRRGVIIRNGHIRGQTKGGFFGGIASSNGAARNVVVSDVTVTDVFAVGIVFYATPIDESVIVERCTVLRAGGDGIWGAGLVRNSSGMECGGAGIYAAIVTGCRGQATGGNTGIFGFTVENSRGTSFSGEGLKADVASNCEGTSSSGTGLEAISATNCLGLSGSGYGIEAAVAQNCFGTTLSGPAAILVSGTASFCRGQRTGGGTAINAHVAIGCTVSGTGTVTAPGGKFLGTP